MLHQLKSFPAFSIVSELTDALLMTNAIVAAPPGAGKSTVLPLSLLNTTDKKILLMQPRRVVVRNLAGYLANLLGEKVGQRVGYRIRGESQVSEQTQLEIITEGILARRIQQDPELSDIGLIIFDEFHERSIHSDFGLALALDVQQGLREDLRLLVMSATLDTAALKHLLPDATVCVAQGRMYDVEEVYSGQVAAHSLHEKIAEFTRQACERVDGDVLVFLPGMGAINKVGQLLSARPPTSKPVIHQLYGAASKDQQTRALQVDPDKRQKIILATNVAETSLTIDNIEAVVDSGLENSAIFNPANGLTQLTQQMISQASATQRKGRAGRLKPGICYRMWGKEQQDRLAAYSTAQILREDICGLLLEALSWGTQLDSLVMLDQPGNAQLASASDTLIALNAATWSRDSSLAITSYGRELARLPCHPRLAHMLIKARDSISSHGPALLQAAVWVAALAEDSGKHAAVLVSEALAGAQGDKGKRLRQQAARYWSRLVGQSAAHPFCKSSEIKSQAIALVIAFAWEDRIAYRQKDQWKMASGRGAQWDGHSGQAQWLAILDGQLIGTQVKVRLAEPLLQRDIEHWFSNRFIQTQEVEFNPQQAQLQARKIVRFDQILLTSEPLQSPSSKQLARAWYNYLQTLDTEHLPLNDAARQWLNRLSLAARLNLPQPQAFNNPEPWPESPLRVLSLINEQSLLTHLSGCKRWEHLIRLPWHTLLHQSLCWPQQHALDHFLPVTVAVPTGNKRTLNYLADGQVILAVKMQEMYGQSTSITIAHNDYPVTLSLLSPAGRPLQMTQNLAAFWQGSYQEIKKEMKGRYPKHYWPDMPDTAVPTTRTKQHNQQR